MGNNSTTNYTANKHLKNKLSTNNFGRHFALKYKQLTGQTINNSLHTSNEDCSKVDKDCQIANQWKLAQRGESAIRVFLRYTYV